MVYLQNQNRSRFRNILRESEIVIESLPECLKISQRPVSGTLLVCLRPSEAMIILQKGADVCLARPQFAFPMYTRRPTRARALAHAHTSLFRRCLFAAAHSCLPLPRLVYSTIRRTYFQLLQSLLDRLWMFLSSRVTSVFS